MEVTHKDTIETITRRALHLLFGPGHDVQSDLCQMQLGEETLDKAAKVGEIDLVNGVHLNLTLPF